MKDAIGVHDLTVSRTASEEPGILSKNASRELYCLFPATISKQHQALPVPFTMPHAQDPVYELRAYMAVCAATAGHTSTEKHGEQSKVYTSLCLSASQRSQKQPSVRQHCRSYAQLHDNMC